MHTQTTEPKLNDPSKISILSPFHWTLSLSRGMQHLEIDDYHVGREVHLILKSEEKSYQKMKKSKIKKELINQEKYEDIRGPPLF